MKKVLAVLADGFEELEAISPIDVLRRAGASVTLAALKMYDGLKVRGSHDIYVQCDSLLSDVAKDHFDAIFFPGGMPGATNLASSPEVKDLILNTYKRGDLVCAICASPAYVLAPLGILDGKKVTCYPGCESVAPNVKFGNYRVVIDANVITSAGPGTALEFGLLIAETLFGKQMSEKLSGGMICK
ncbi:MAG: DJ-1/PfpI family protein [Spirochaetales bacterium]|nr:DJ-1/PfpI family protein [Spirochaetales bacterium]